jgi:hypothetical protein
VPEARPEPSPEPEEHRVEDLCECIFMDQYDNEKHGIEKARPKYPYMKVKRFEVVTPPGFDAERGVCVGRFELVLRYDSYSDWYNVGFDWASSGIPNPPTDWRASLPFKDRCCTVWRHLPDGRTVCWRDAP